MKFTKTNSDCSMFDTLFLRFDRKLTVYMLLRSLFSVAPTGMNPTAARQNRDVVKSKRVSQPTTISKHLGAIATKQMDDLRNL